jgi:hypothetical protein
MDKSLIGNGDLSILVNTWSGGVPTPRVSPPAADSDYDQIPADTNGFEGMFGNCKIFKFENKIESKERFKSVRGLRVLDDSVAVQIQNGYIVTIDEFDARLAWLLFSGKGATPATEVINGKTYDIVAPFTAPQGIRGYGRVRIWDPRNQVNPRLFDTGFFCVARMNGQPDLNDDFLKLELKLDILQAGKVGMMRMS